LGSLIHENPQNMLTLNYYDKIGFKVFLNITPTVTNWASDNKQFSLVFDENPLADFVELPDDGRAQNELWYSNILCGVLRGALEMVSTYWLCSQPQNIRSTLGLVRLLIPANHREAALRLK
jgi:hypothetical protein